MSFECESLQLLYFVFWRLIPNKFKISLKIAEQCMCQEGIWMPVWKLLERIWKEMTDKIWGKNVLSRSVEWRIWYVTSLSKPLRGQGTGMHVHVHQIPMFGMFLKKMKTKMRVEQEFYQLLLKKWQKEQVKEEPRKFSRITQTVHPPICCGIVIVWSCCSLSTAWFLGIA